MASGREHFNNAETFQEVLLIRSNADPEHLAFVERRLQGDSHDGDEAIIQDWARSEAQRERYFMMFAH